MSDFQKIVADLRRPFTPAAVKWKIQTNPKGKGPAIIVGYIDARLVAERLNQVVGQDWSDTFSEIHVSQSAAFVTCRLTVAGTMREDVGWSQGCGTDMATKTVYSDAFKRAAVKFGVGAFLYAIPAIKLWPDDLESWGEGDKKKYALGQAARQKLSQRYATWTTNEQIVERFGKPIDHGDRAEENA